MSGIFDSCVSQAHKFLKSCSPFLKIITALLTQFPVYYICRILTHTAQARIYKLCKSILQLSAHPCTPCTHTQYHESYTIKVYKLMASLTRDKSILGLFFSFLFILQHSQLHEFILTLAPPEIMVLSFHSYKVTTLQFCKTCSKFSSTLLVFCYKHVYFALQVIEAQGQLTRNRPNV